MEIRYDYWEGCFTKIYNSLIKSTSQYTSRNVKVKFGITNNPENRKKQHFRSDEQWDFLIVKYKTSSVRFINKMETFLIDYQKDFIINRRRGGGGRNGAGPYYLYVLLKK